MRTYGKEGTYERRKTETRGGILEEAESGRNNNFA